MVRFESAFFLLTHATHPVCLFPLEVFRAFARIGGNVVNVIMVNHE